MVQLSHPYKWSEVAKSCLTLCDPMDYSLTDFSIHGIFQGRVPEWLAISFSRGSSQCRDWTQVSHIAGRCFTLWATRKDTSIQDYRKTIALNRWTFVSKVMSLLFNMLSSFVMAFLPRSKYLLISWLQSPTAAILESKKIKSFTASTFSFIN